MLLCYLPCYSLGLVFDESAPRDMTLEVPPAKPVVKLKEDPKQSQVRERERERERE